RAGGTARSLLPPPNRRARPGGCSCPASGLLSVTGHAGEVPGVVEELVQPPRGAPEGGAVLDGDQVDTQYQQRDYEPDPHGDPDLLELECIIHGAHRSEERRVGKERCSLGWG